MTDQADASERWHHTEDRERLLVRTVSAKAGPLRGDVVLVHGYMEHGGRYSALAQTFANLGLRAVVLDLRGHGRSSGIRGHVRTFEDYLSDVEDVLFGSAADATAPPFVFGHSMGGLIALHLAARHGARLRGVLLSNPYLHNALPISKAKLALGQVARRLWPTLRAPSGIRREWLTHDPNILQALAADPLMFDSATAGWFHATRQAQASAAAVGRLDCPLWMGVGDSDGIASPSHNVAFAERVLAPGKQLVRYPGALHELLNDLVKEEFLRDTAKFVSECAAAR